MTVYVTPPKPIKPTRTWPYRTHAYLAASTSDELIEFAERLGLPESMLQRGEQWNEHYDIVATKQRAAVRLGAQVISVRDLARRVRARWDRRQQWTY